MPSSRDRPDPGVVRAVRAALAAAAAAGETITYAELVEAVPRLEELRDSGALGPVLGEVSREEDAAGRGMLSAVVVRSRGEPLPAAGFFRLAAELGRDASDRDRCWRAELGRVFASHRG